MKIKSIYLFYFFIAFISIINPQQAEASNSSPIQITAPFHLFSSNGQAATFNINPVSKPEDGGDTFSIIQVPHNRRILEIPGFPLFRVILGDTPLGTDAFFSALMYPSVNYFQIQLSGSICLGFPKAILKPVSAPKHTALCQSNELELQFGRAVNTPKSINDFPDLAEGFLEFNAVMDFNTGEFYLTGIDLPEVDIFGLGLTMSASNIALDLSDFFNPWEVLDPPHDLDTPEQVDHYWSDFDQLDTAFSGEDLSDTQWKGLYIQEAKITPKLLGINTPIKVHHLIIDHHGLTGAINAPITQKVSLGGFSADSAQFNSIFVRNTLKDTHLSVDLEIFNGKARGLLAFDIKGHWSAKLGPMPSEDLVKVCFPTSCSDAPGATPHIRLNLEELRLGHEKEQGPLVLTVDGKVSLQKLVGKVPGFGDLDCPPKKADSDYSGCGLDFSGYQITFSSPGKMNPPEELGGWVNISQFKEKSFYGFNFNIRKIGFGTLAGFQDFEKQGWFGIGGNFALGDEFGIGVTLNELRFKWGSPAGSGCQLGPWSGVCLEIPNIDIEVNKQVVKLKGALAWHDGGQGNQNFKGAIEATFPSLEFSVGATLYIGQEKTAAQHCQYWYFDAQTQFPTGIPIASNVSIYGFMGGAGYHVRSELIDTNNDGIYEGYKNWDKLCDDDAYAFIVGLTLGTSSDNGYVVNADTSLLIETSGPVITLDGRGWILQNRFDRGEPTKPSNVYALIRYDGHQDIFLMQVTGFYQVESKGLTLINLSGGFEILASPPEWHVYLGWKGYECQGPPPRQRAEKKLEVNILSLFDAQGYFMVGSMTPFPKAKDCRPAIMLGAGFDYGKEIDAKIITIYAQSWGSGDLAISWHPTQTFAAFGLGGKLGFSLFGIDFGRGFDANAQGQYPSPAELLAHVSFSLPLPWPLPDVRISFDITLKEKEPGIGDIPPFPHPLRSVELTFPQGNLSKNKHSIKLEEGKIKNIPLLNPRFVSTFHRPITGELPINSPPFNKQPVSKDVLPFGGWKKATPQAWVDQVGQFQAWYRFRYRTFKEFEEPQELLTCGAEGGRNVAIKGYWGSVYQDDPGNAWNTEKQLIMEKPAVGKKETLAPSDHPVNQRRRQLYAWHATALPYPGGTPLTDAIFEQEDLIITDPPKALKPNTFYQIKLVARHDWYWPKTNQTGGTGGAAHTLDTKKFMEKNITAENKYYCFRTGPAPLDLTPYIAWTNPIADAKNIFYGDDLMVLFNTAGMKALYNHKAPKFIIYTQNGKALGKGELTLNEQLLHISGTDLIKSGIKPRERYFVKIQDPYYQLPAYSFQFTTSQYQSFSALMEANSTKIGGPNIVSTQPLTAYQPLSIKQPDTDFIVVNTPEPLPWSHNKLKVTLKDAANNTIPIERLTPDHGTQHVFIRQDKKNLTPGNYKLIFSYARHLPAQPKDPTLVNTSALIQDAKNRISALTFVPETAIMQLPAPIIDVEIKELTFTRKL